MLHFGFTTLHFVVWQIMNFYQKNITICKQNAVFLNHYVTPPYNIMLFFTVLKIFSKCNKRKRKVDVLYKKSSNTMVATHE